MSDFNRRYGELPASQDEFFAEGMLLVKQQVAKRLRLCPGWQHMAEDFVADGNLALTVLSQTPNVKKPAAWLTSAVRRNINRATKRPSHVSSPDWEDVADARDDAGPLLRDLEELAADEVDRRIIAGRAAGFSDPELVEQVGLSSQAIGERRRRMGDKFAAGGAPIDKGAKGGRRGDRHRR